MAEKLMKIYEMMSASAQKELYDFALFLLSKNEDVKPAIQKKIIFWCIKR